MRNKQESPDDDLVFLDELDSSDLKPQRAVGDVTTWRVMIVDDDPDVHTATTFALNNVAIQNRQLSFLHAYSTSQAKELLKTEPDIALILLDVVMEREDAGFQLVGTIRKELGLAEVRIILRTGQPGYAPEIDAIRDFDINDYKTKSDLTRTKLFTTVTAALRSFEQICSINAQRRASEITNRTIKELILQTHLHEFSEITNRGIIDYFMQTNCNLLLFKQKADNSVVTMIGSNDPSTHLNNKHSDHEAIVKMVKSCLGQKKNKIESDRAVLYFDNSASTQYALFVGMSNEFTTNDVHFLTVFSSSVAVCLDNILLHIRLRSHAFTDSLTQLPNRLNLLNFLDQILANKFRPQTTLALIDIDHFAETNNALGHQFGDQLLCSVADRLHDRFKQSCKVARVGNDTFALVGHEEIVQPEAISTLFHSSFQVDKQEVHLRSTIGLVKLDDYTGNSSDALKDTNIALKRAKAQHRGGHVFFTTKMGIEIREHVRLMRSLANAHQKKHLFVSYQPQINIADGAVIGAEALMRWKTTEGKLIPPQQFIPIAEYSGLIIELGEWILRSACFELSELMKAGYTNFKMSVNVSQAQFTHPNFMHSVEKAIHDSGIPPHLLDLEITESMAMNDPNYLIDILTRLKKIGVKISIDDFGTGFSSLSYLQKLPVDQLKIDRSFVSQIGTDMSTSSIPQMIIQLCESLGLSVIAEGVEDLKQAESLMSFGCSLAQGFFYAKPMDALALREWLKNR